MDAKEYLKKRRVHCDKIKCGDCLVEKWCLSVGKMTDDEIEKEVAFFETQKSTCPTCGAPVEVCGGVTKFVPGTFIDVDAVAQGIIALHNNENKFSWFECIKYKLLEALK